MPGLAIRSSIIVLLFLSGASLARAQVSQNRTQAQSTQSQQTGQQNDSNDTSTQATEPHNYTTGEEATTGPAPSLAPSVTTAPLTGAEEFTLSHMGKSHSYLIPSFQYGQSLITSGTSAFSTSTMESLSTISGLFALHHVWRRYSFTAQYDGVGFLYNTDSALNTSAHNFTLTQGIEGKRSSLILTDVTTYLPQSGYGYARFTGLGGIGGSSYGYGGLSTAATAGLDTQFLPGQSLLTGASSQLGNTIVGEYNYLTGPLSTVTITGSYVTLWFPGSQYINTDDALLQIGYNHVLSPQNSMGLSYQAGIFRFGSLGGNFTNHVLLFTYRRTINNRLALQLGAGPQVNVFDNTVAQSGYQVSWQANALITYQLERLAIAVSYLHYTSGGSGIYRGAHTDYTTLSTSLPLSREWSVNLSGGYAYNTALQVARVQAPTLSYNTWYGTFDLTHTLNRWMSMYMGYNLQEQVTSQATCIASACGTFYTQQYLSFGINWHPVLLGIE